MLVTTASLETMASLVLELVETTELMRASLTDNRPISHKNGTASAKAGTTRDPATGMASNKDLASTKDGTELAKDQATAKDGIKYLATAKESESVRDPAAANQHPLGNYLGLHLRLQVMHELKCEIKKYDLNGSRRLL